MTDNTRVPHNADLHAQIDRDQAWHKPEHPVIGAALDRIREIGLRAAHQWADIIPNNPHARRALELIDEAQMYAVKSIVTDQDDVIDRLAPAPLADGGQAQSLQSFTAVGDLSSYVDQGAPPIT